MTSTRHLVAVIVALAVVAVLGGRAEAKALHFVGPHPIATKAGGGFCYIEAPHMHAYAPDRGALYEQVQGQYVFTGDPTPFGYEGDKHTFYGNHPIVSIGAEPVFCFLDGPHVHSFAPPEVPEYKVEKGVAFYVGPTPPAVARMRPQRARAINAEYRPFVALRPTVEVAPPPEWHGEVWVAPPAVEVAAPSLRVNSPGVVVGAPGVVVGAPGVVVSAPGVYVAPPPPPSVHVRVGGPGVYVAPPPSVTVGAPGVYVAPPGAVYVGPGRGKRHGEWEREEHEHHDNGKHKGWHK